MTTITVRISAEPYYPSDPTFSEQDLFEAVQATLHEVYPVQDYTVVPTVERVESSDD